MKPVVDRLRSEYGGTVEFVVFADINGREDVRSFAIEQRISVVPTMVLVAKDGKELRRIVGSLPEADIREVLDSAR